jgi:cytochrome c oxidase subunit 4
VVAERAIPARTQVTICSALVLLTCLTIGLSFLHLPAAGHLSLGLTIGLCKASLVVLFFMHVLHSDRLTWIVIAVVCVWLLILFALTLTDYLTRGIVPNMPGH